MKKIFTALIAFSFVPLLILNYATVQSSAENAVFLCLHSVVPSIFPFLVISSVIVSSGSAAVLGKPFGGLFKKLFGVRECCAAPIILGLTAGFPIGAVCCYRLYKNAEITKSEAEYLLSFCSNSGISFIFGVLGSAVFKNIKIGILIFLIQTASSFLVGILLRPKSENVSLDTPPSPQPVSIQSAIVNSVKSSVVNIAYICGYIISFAVLTELLQVYLPKNFAFGIKAIFELTGAAYELSGFPQKTALILACGILSWSGLCVHMQIRSVTGELNLKPYFTGKLIHMASSMLCAYLVPLEEHIGTYCENVSVTYRAGGFEYIFFIIIIIIISCILLNNVVK